MRQWIIKSVISLAIAGVGAGAAAAQTDKLRYAGGRASFEYTGIRGAELLLDATGAVVAVGIPTSESTFRLGRSEGNEMLLCGVAYDPQKWGQGQSGRQFMQEPRTRVGDKLWYYTVFWLPGDQSKQKKYKINWLRTGANPQRRASKAKLKFGYYWLWQTSTLKPTKAGGFDTLTTSIKGVGDCSTRFRSLE